MPGGSNSTDGRTRPTSSSRDPDATRPRASIRALTKAAVVRWLKGAESVRDLDTDKLAQYLVDEMRSVGLAVHNVEHCVRIPPEARTLGRKMSEEEALALGASLVSTGPPSVAAMQSEE